MATILKLIDTHKIDTRRNGDIWSSGKFAWSGRRRG